MRAMPSPTSSTRPTSTASIWERYSLISSSITERISSALNLMTATLDNFFADIVQPGAHRAVEQPVADLHHHAAQQVGIDLRLQHRFQVKRRSQLLDEPLALVVRQRHG